MKFGGRNTLWASTALLLFMAGFAAGVYYHREALVWWWHWTGTMPIEETAPAAPATPEVQSSYIELPALADELPLVYSDTVDDEPKIQEYLKSGAVVLPLGTSFGEPGNVVVTAHSSGTAAFGPYRFAFAGLADLKEGQEYYITTPAARYTYRVYAHDVVWPHEVDKLPRDDRSTVTLVTCWPLWTNFKRLLVHSELVNVERKL
jgi:LPXTG-site transpeptidase (sortase) family protein